jgi:hypothetical protein
MLMVICLTAQLQNPCVTKHDCEMNQLGAVLNNPTHYRYIIIEDDVNTRFYTKLLLRKIEISHNARIVDSHTFDSIEALDQAVNQENIAVMDISWLSWQFGLLNATSLVHRLIKTMSVVCIVHKDVHKQEDLGEIEVFSNAIIRIIGLDDQSVSIDGEEKILDKSSVNFGCEVKSIRNKSKLISSREYFRIIDGKEGVFSFVKDPFVSIKKKTDTDRPMNKEDIDRQVPFKISMSEQEKKSRDSAVIKQDNPKKGFIIIDEEEDLDDDPDDDLDI